MFSRTQLLPGAVNNAFNSFHQYVADWLVFTCVLPPIFYPLTPRVPRFQKHPLLDKMSCESGFPRFFHQGLRNFATGPTGYQSGSNQVNQGAYIPRNRDSLPTMALAPPVASPQAMMPPSSFKAAKALSWTWGLE